MLVVMVGESIQEVQQAHWLATTPVHLPIPAWMGLWFAVFPNVASLVAQALGALIVVGSYVVAQYLRVWRPRQQGVAPAHRAEAAPMATIAPLPETTLVQNGS